MSNYMSRLIGEEALLVAGAGPDPEVDAVLVGVSDAVER